MKNLLFTILIGALCGFLGGEIIGIDLGGFIVNAIIGIVGSLLATTLFGKLGINLSIFKSGNYAGLLNNIVIGVIGAILLLLAISFVKGIIG